MWYVTPLRNVSPGRLRVARVLGLCTLLGALLVGSPERASAGRLPSDPVEDLRQALKQYRDASHGKEALEFRKQNLEKKARALQNISQLSRGLLLQDWQDEGLDVKLREIDDAVRREVADRFTAVVKDILEHGTPAARAAVANFVGELAVNVRAGGSKSNLVRERLSKLADLLAKAAENPEPSVRQAAALALGKINPDPEVAVKALAPLLSSGDVATRRAAAEALGNLVREPLQNLKKDPHETGQATVTSEVRKAAEPVTPVAGRGLRDRDAVVRRLCADALHQSAVALSELVPDPTPQDFPPEGRKLTEEEMARVKAYAKEVRDNEKSLQRLMKELSDQTPALGVALVDPDPDARLLAGRTLEELGSARQKLLRYVGTIPAMGQDTTAGGGAVQAGENGQPRVTAVALAMAPQAKVADEALLEGLKKGVPGLAAAVADPDVRIRLAAIDALEMLEDAALPAAPALTRALSDRDKFVRWAAARTLGKLGPVNNANPVPALARMVEDPDLDLRVAAMTALERYGPAAKAALPALAHASFNGDAEARIAAMKALEGIGTDAVPAVPAIARGLSDSDPRVRRAAAETLGRFGPSAQAAIDALRRALNDPDPDVRRSVSEGLLDVSEPDKK